MSGPTNEYDRPTAKRGDEVYKLVRRSGYRGITALEVMHALGETDKNKVAPVLCRLHEQGLITRLADERLAHKIYVHPRLVDGRDEVPYGRGKERS